MRTYSNCQDAVQAFCSELTRRGLVIAKREKVKANLGRGRFLYEDRIITATKEVYHIKCRPRGRWIPKDSSQISEVGRELDERYKYLIRVFGNGDPSISGFSEDRILDLLEMENQGYTTYLVTLFPKTGEVLWCHAYEAYDMVMRYGTLPQLSFQGIEGMTFCSIPTGWMKKWQEVVFEPPSVASE